MSHALNIYISYDKSGFNAEENNNDKKYFLMYYTGGSEVYQAFRENGINHYWGMEDDSYAVLDHSVIDVCLEDTTQNIKDAMERLNTYEKHCNGLPENIAEILSLKEYIKTLNDRLKEINFLAELIDRTSFVDNVLYYNTD